MSPEMKGRLQCAVTAMRVAVTNMEVALAISDEHPRLQLDHVMGAKHSIDDAQRGVEEALRRASKEAA